MAHGRPVLLSCLLLSGLLAAQEQPLQGAARATFTRKVAASMARVDAVVATFEQEKHYALFDEVAKQHGVILYQRPDRIFLR